MKISVSAQTPSAVVVGRNGTFDCVALVFESYADHDASIEAIGKRGDILNAGMYSIPIQALDEICLAWLRSRGLLPARADSPSG